MVLGFVMDAGRRGRGSPNPVNASFWVRVAVALYNNAETTTKRIKASLIRKGIPKGKTCAEFCEGKIQTCCHLGVILL